MTAVFLSYSRQNHVQARTLAEDVKALGHQVWMDQELSGGQVWWAQILERVRACDVFLCTLAPESLASEACRRELAYALALGKPILPTMIADGVPPHLLPPPLASLHIIDHRTSDRTSVAQLARALASLPATPPLPAPLPAPPPAPLSYLATLLERIDSEQPLDLQAQNGVVLDLKRALRDPGSVADGLTLLTRFRQRRDLFALTAEELDELARAARRAQPWTAPAPRRDAPPAVPERKKAMIVGFVVGSAIGIVSVLSVGLPLWELGFVLGVASACAGAITGVRRRHVVHAVASGLGTAFLVGAYAVLQGDTRVAFPAGTIWGAPVGLVFGAAISVLLARRAMK